MNLNPFEEYGPYHSYVNREPETSLPEKHPWLSDATVETILWPSENWDQIFAKIADQQIAFSPEVY